MAAGDGQADHADPMKPQPPVTRSFIRGPPGGTAGRCRPRAARGILVRQDRRAGASSRCQGRDRPSGRHRHCRGCERSVHLYCTSVSAVSVMKPCRNPLGTNSCRPVVGGKLDRDMPAKGGPSRRGCPPPRQELRLGCSGPACPAPGAATGSAGRAACLSWPRRNGCPAPRAGQAPLRPCVRHSRFRKTSHGHRRTGGESGSGRPEDRFVQLALSLHEKGLSASKWPDHGCNAISHRGNSGAQSVDKVRNPARLRSSRKRARPWIGCEGRCLGRGIARRQFLAAWRTRSARSGAMRPVSA